MSLQQKLIEELYKGPRSIKQLSASLGVNNKRVSRALGPLVSNKKVRLRKRTYSLVSADGPLLQSTLVKLARNFGFAEPDDGSGDIFIPGHSLSGAMPGDTLLVTLSRHPRRAGTREGEVHSVIKRHNPFTGTVEKRGKQLIFKPDTAPDTPIVIERNADGGAQPGEKVAANITSYGARHDRHRASVTLRFGSADSARECTNAMLYSAGIETKFSKAVWSESERIASGTRITQKDLEGRRDLRDEPIFTIDAATTKDIDDAISVKKVLDGYVVGVHIADVSHYVPRKSAVDSEALKRGNSIYYADSVVPMLPPHLSNDVCSLNPGEDRLAFSCFITLDHDGTMLDYRFYKSVIQSKVQGVYSEINQIFDGAANDAIKEKYADVYSSFPLIDDVYQKLAHLRKARGCMEIESEEAELIIDDNGVCVGVKKRQRGKTERVIEEFMLLANTAAAHLARRAELPFIYRVHDDPSSERVESLKEMLTAARVDFHFQHEVPTQQELSALLNETRGTNLEMPVHTGILRSMAKAEYEPTPKGHYGLVLRDYAHFTSPIRRYPDLVVHRILSAYVAGETTAQINKTFSRFTELAAEQATEREIEAQKLERDCDDVYKAEFMRSKLGDVFPGVISSVVPFGVYVALENSVEGLIHITDLSERRLELVEGIAFLEPVSGKEFRLGDDITVQVAGANVSQGNIDFVVSEG